jgi:Ca2+/Na+ antiporter
MIQKLIENNLPGRKTSLFFALLIFGFACFFLWMGKIASSEWMVVSLYVMTAYVVKRQRSNENEAVNRQQLMEEFGIEEAKK